MRERHDENVFLKADLALSSPLYLATKCKRKKLRES